MRRNVLVNGDDMLFRCTFEFYAIFVETASDVGFKMSQGKQYLSPHSCMINSQVFTEVHRTMRRCGYLNLKLITGKSVKDGDSKAIPTQITRDLNRMVRLCPWTHSAIPFSLSRWGKDYFGPVFRPNWYLPVSLGGLGLDPSHAPSTVKLTRGQRVMAARFVNDPKLSLYRVKGMDIPTTKLAGALANWRWVVGDYVPMEHEHVALNDPWLERLAFAARAHQGSSTAVKDKVLISRFRPQYRLKPMSIEGIDLYWDAQVYATNLPPCPPLGHLQLKSILEI